LGFVIGDFIDLPKIKSASIARTKDVVKRTCACLGMWGWNPHGLNLFFF